MLNNTLAHESVRSGQDTLDLRIPLEPTPKRRSFRGMTYKKMCERIRLGYGIGHGSNYLPWLTIRRKNPSPKSNQIVSWMPPLQRPAHYFSRGEYHTALLLLWLGVRDLREQYPIWPIPHPHPLSDLLSLGDSSISWSKGLLQIAKEAGIEHGREIGTKLPYIATLDLVATIPVEQGFGLAIFSSKPIQEPNDAVKWRTLERLELERRYALDISARYAVSNSSLIPVQTAGQLEWWFDCATLHDLPHLRAHVDAYACYFNHFSDLSLNEAVARAAESTSITADDGWALFRHCAWNLKIDIDPTQRILTSYPIHRGGVALRDRLRRQLFGEAWI